MQTRFPMFRLCVALIAVWSASATAQQAPGKETKRDTKQAPARDATVPQILRAASGTVKPDTKPQTPSAPKPGAGTATLAAPLPTQKELLARAAQMLKDNKPAEAAKFYRQAITLYPTAYEPYDRLARIELELRSFEEAAVAARKATELNVGRSQELVQEYFILASALTELARYDEARIAAGHSVELAPGEADYRLLQGDIAMRAKDYTGAETYYLNALGLAPDSSRAHSGLGDVYEQLGQHLRALLEYEAAARAVSGDGPGVAEVKRQFELSQATSLAGLKRFAEAEKMARAVLAKSPDNPTYHSALAQVLDACGKHDEAISEYRSALNKSAGDAILWGNLGWAQYNAEKYADALVSCRKALELDPKQSYVRFNLGLIYAVQNQWKEAQKEYQAAIVGAAEPDIRAGMNDLQDAIERRPGVAAIHQALELLNAADRKALGFTE